MSIRNRILYIILICFTIYSCNNSKKQTNDLEGEKYEIMSLLIEKLPAGPPPPPPGVYKKDTIAFNRYVDSIYQLDVNIGIINEFVMYNDDREFNDLEKEYQILIEKLQSIKDSTKHKIELEKISVKKNRKLRIFSSTDNTRQLLLDGSVDYVIRFSEIVLNPEKNKAVVASSAYPHPKGGSSVLYFFKKENGNWRIFKQKLLSIS
jgi:hypothetical protein